MLQNKIYPSIKTCKCFSIDFFFFDRVKAKKVDIEIVLDFNLYGEIIGLEILDIKRQAGTNIFEGAEWNSIKSNSNFKFSYDQDIDAWYFLFKKDKSSDQKAITGCLLMDDKGKLACIEVKEAIN